MSRDPFNLKNTEIRVFDGAVAIITGAASGFGRGLAEELSKKGCEVVVADMQAELANEVARGITNNGGKATAVHLDVREFSAVEKLINDTRERTGRLDYMFNNAGVAIAGFVNTLSMDDWNLMIDVNLKGVVHGTHAAYKVMLEQGYGHIVNTSSINGLIPGNATYAATKHGVVGLSTSLAIEAAYNGIAISVLCPGAIATPMLEYGGKYGRVDDLIPLEVIQEQSAQYNPMHPNKLAELMLPQVARKKTVILAPMIWRVAWWLFRLSNNITYSILKRRYIVFLDELTKRGIKLPFTKRA